MFNMMSGNITTNFVVDNNWYLDLGATHHFTPDYSKLTSATPFTRSDQVAVGDGEKFQFLMLDMLLFQILHILFYLITYVTHLSFQIILSVCPNCVETIRPLLNFILIIFLWRIKTRIISSSKDTLIVASTEFAHYHPPHANPSHFLSPKPSSFKPKIQHLV